MLFKIFKFLVYTLCVVLAGGVAANITYNKVADSYLDKLDRTEEIEVEEIEVFDMEEYEHNDIENIVLLGIDSVDGASRSDAIKLISIDKTNYDITITSLQRDNLVYQPMQGRYEKLNHAYWYNRVEGTLSAINYSMDLDVKKYVAINFSSLEKVVDIVGGIDVELTDVEAGTLHLGGAGTYHLNGKSTLNYCRIRSTDNDYYRMQRQNNAIKGVIAAIRNKSVTEILDVVGKLLPFIETNLTNSEIKSYAKDILKYDLNNIYQYQFPSNGYDDVLTSIVVMGWGPNYILKDYVGQVQLLHERIYGHDGYEPSDNVKKIAADSMKLAGMEE